MYSFMSGRSVCTGNAVHDRACVPSGGVSVRSIAVGSTVRSPLLVLLRSTGPGSAPKHHLPASTSSMTQVPLGLTRGRAAVPRVLVEPEFAQHVLARSSGPSSAPGDIVMTSPIEPVGLHVPPL